jgi:CRP/FNR family cyclic AMP-dependent transcriptional regulator
VSSEVESTSLSSLPLFQGLDDEQLARVESMVRRRRFPSGASLINTSDIATGIYVIVEGSVKIQVEQPEGRNVILALAGRGQIVGEMGVVENLERSASVVTIEPCVVIWMNGSDFRSCLESIPPFALNLIRILSSRLRLANAHIQALAALDVDGRVATQILAFADEYGQVRDGTTIIQLHVTQSDLADLIGASRVRVNQVLSKYRERGLITLPEPHQIRVLDRPGLERRCGQIGVID